MGEDEILKRSKSWSISTLRSDHKHYVNYSNPFSVHNITNINNKLFFNNFTKTEKREAYKIDPSRHFLRNESLGISNAVLKRNLLRNSENNVSNLVQKPILCHSSSFCVSSKNQFQTKKDTKYPNRPNSSFQHNILNKINFCTNYESKINKKCQNKGQLENSTGNSFYIPMIKNVFGVPSIQTSNLTNALNSKQFLSYYSKQNTETIKKTNIEKNTHLVVRDKFLLKPLYNQENTTEFLNNKTLRRLVAVNVNSNPVKSNRMVNTSSPVNLHGTQCEHLETINNESCVSISDVDIKSLLGFGSTSLVYLAVWRGTNVAIKIFGNNNLKEINENSLDFKYLIKPLGKDLKDCRRCYEFKCELNLLKKVRHPNIVQYMGGNTIENPPFLICEFCSGGTLFNLLHGSSNKCSNGKNYIFSGPKIELSVYQRLKILLDVAKGLHFLHTSNPIIIHRDIKSLNIFLSTPIVSDSDIPIAKIGDFGLCQQLNSTCYKSNCESLVGTYQWMAPEVIVNQIYNEYIDIYSFGMTMYEVLSNKTPFIEMGADVNPDFLANQIIRGVRPSLDNIPIDIPSEIVDTMISCWDHVPSNRTSMLKIIKTLETYIDKYDRFRIDK